MVNIILTEWEYAWFSGYKKGLEQAITLPEKHIEILKTVTSMVRQWENEHECK